MSGDYASTDDIMSDLSTSKEESSAPAAGQSPQQAVPPPWQEDEYTIEGGKKIKENREMILKRAGMGYHYAQKMHDLNQKEALYKEKDGHYTKLDEQVKQLSKWKEFNDYAQTNPDWWEHVDRSWQERQNLQQSTQDPVNPHLESLNAKIAALEGKLSEYGETIGSFKSKEEQIKHEAEDKEFQSEIDSVGKKFGVDLSQADENGKSLQWKVLEHMTAMGLDGSKQGHFRSAFLDYYHENLLGRVKDEAVEKHAKADLEAKKAGILGVSRTPQASAPKGINYRKSSYDDLSSLMKKELLGESY